MPSSCAAPAASATRAAATLDVVDPARRRVVVLDRAARRRRPRRAGERSRRRRRARRGSSRSLSTFSGTAVAAASAATCATSSSRVTCLVELAERPGEPGARRRERLEAERREQPRRARRPTDSASHKTCSRQVQRAGNARVGQLGHRPQCTCRGAPRVSLQMGHSWSHFRPVKSPPDRDSIPIRTQPPLADSRKERMPSRLRRLLGFTAALASGLALVPLSAARTEHAGARCDGDADATLYPDHRRRRPGDDPVDDGRSSPSSRARTAPSRRPRSPRSGRAPVRRARSRGRAARRDTGSTWTCSTSPA